MPLPRVSVLCLTYNQQAFVEQTLLSALEQEYDNLQVVVSDDCSSDSTPGMIRALAEKFPGRLVPVLSDVRGGITANMNRGLAACDGEYIAFLGGDDIFLPGKIAKQVAFMQARPEAVLSHHDVDVFDAATDATLYLWSGRYGKHSGGADSVIRLGTYMCGTSVMARRESLPKQGGDTRIPFASDWLLWVETLVNSGGQMAYLDEVLARYRRSSGNVTRNWDWKFEEQNLTLAIIEARWPQYTSLVRKRRAEFYFVQAVRRARLKEWKAAWHLGLGAAFAAFPSAPWLRLAVRELAFLIRRRGKSDDLMDNLGNQH
jgi:glycosyltransferase involved in cell wall biosynthesis